MFAVIVGALLATGTQATSVAARLGREGSPFAINGTKLFHVPTEIETTIARRLGWMKELGVAWDRTDLWWHVVEPEPGKFDFSRPDLAIATFEKAGVQWYPILCYGAAWFKGRTGPQTDEERAAFARFAERTVARYRGRVPYWSVWNEPNIPPFWTPTPDADGYARLLRVTAAAIRRADPKAKVCAPAIAPTGPWDQAFAERIFRLGALKDLDVFDYHYYRNGPPEDEVPAEIAEIRATMRRYGKEKPIWISETGVSTWFDGVEMAERQAALIVRNQLLCLAHGVSRVFYFDLQNWFDDRPETWDTHLGLVKASGERKPSFHAYRTMVREVGPRRVVGPVRTIGKTGTGVLFVDRHTGRFTLAAWTRSLDGAEDVPIEGLPAATVVGPYGQRSPLPSGATKVRLGPNPTYLVGIRADAFLSQAGVRFDVPRVILCPGESAELRVFTDPTIGSSAATVRRFEAAGLTWSPRAGRLSVPRGAAAGERTVRALVAIGATASRTPREVWIEARVRVEPTVTVSVRPRAEGTTLFAAGTVRNHGGRALAGSLTGIRQTAGGTMPLLAPVPVRVPGMGESAVRSSFLRPTLRAEEVWHLRALGTAARPIRALPVPLDASTAPVRVDADLSEWGSQPAARIEYAGQVVRNPLGWRSPVASGRFWLRFQRDGFHLAAKVTDDDPMVNDEPPYTMWKMDSVELYLGLGGPTNRTLLDKSAEYQLGFAPTTREGGPAAFWFHEDKPIAGAKVVARRTPDGYALEAWVPWAGIRADGARLRVGQAIGLDFKLNDRDRRDRAPDGGLPGRDLVWSGTGANWIDPSNWGIGILVAAQASDAPPRSSTSIAISGGESVRTVARLAGSRLR